jgi:hypothetical protein
MEWETFSAFEGNIQTQFNIKGAIECFAQVKHWQDIQCASNCIENPVKCIEQRLNARMIIFFQSEFHDTFNK